MSRITCHVSRIFHLWIYPIGKGVSQKIRPCRLQRNKTKGKEKGKIRESKVKKKERKRKGYVEDSVL